ncbi:hypothetical protein [Thalassospira alkalitolerans]|uniref:hypothetical protein n=1 Tax=Thalassospira alkalitolerans TaxID=1293890 RepID=UPI003AA961D8
MSNVNVKRLVENIRSGTNIYTPLVELVVNAIQAIEQKEIDTGLVEISVLRSEQKDLIDRTAEVNGFVVKDNGIGFTQSNRDSFDTLYTTQKVADGGKGFGRFTCLKYFDNVKVSSTFSEDGKNYDRSFKMGLDTEIILDETCGASRFLNSGSVVEISSIKSVKFPEKNIELIGRGIFERLLPYFVDKERRCPSVVIFDSKDPSRKISLNNYLRTQDSQIAELKVKNRQFDFLENEMTRSFQVRIFKFYSPKSAKSKISLVAHRREVTSNPLQTYIPEFEEEFFEPNAASGPSSGRNFIIKAYVYGDYLNENVTLERGEFRFQADSDLLNSISQSQIEQKAAEIAKTAMGFEISERSRRKEARIEEYVASQAPWHRTLAKEADFSTLSMKPSNQDIEIYLQKKKYENEIATRAQVNALLESDNPDELSQKIAQVVESISDSSKNDLAHYVSLRRCVLDLFSKSLEIGTDGKHRSEGDVHDIIMSRRKDSDQIDYDDHNLWILDERLNFSTYISSDKPLNMDRGDRTDITIFNKRIAFRGENEDSNPITIFEFKKPQRDDFANPSSNEDPIQQIVRYVNQIKDGKFKTPKGRGIHVSKTTPFYGYVVCDLGKKVSDWLEREKDFTPMPDGLGWFRWFGNINLYMEVISWEKLLRDAEMRNKIFFSKLGIN